MITETRTQVTFTDVGPRKKTWTAMILIEDGLLDEEEMYKSVRKSHALGSRGIDFTDDGLILVGGFRPVGRWEVTRTVESEAAKCQSH